MPRPPLWTIERLTASGHWRAVIAKRSEVAAESTAKVLAHVTGATYRVVKS